MTNRQRRPRRLARLAAVPLTFAWMLTAVGPADAAPSTCVSLSGAQPPSSGAGSDNALIGVAQVSACDAWAVGAKIEPDVLDESSAQTLIEHWDGSSWSVVPSPNPGTVKSTLFGVAVASASSVWAVGAFASNDDASSSTLIEHWDGTSWTQVSSPSPIGTSVLDAVSAVSPTNVWAVGHSGTGFSAQTLIEHWDGSAWSVVPSPSVSPATGSSSAFNALVGVTAMSGTDAWVVGTLDGSGTASHPLIEHWNGSSWSVVTAPDPGGSNGQTLLAGVAASSATDAWAIGSFSSDGSTRHPLIEHWDGRSWSVVPAPSLGDDSFLNGVAVSPTRTGWVLGSAFDGTTDRTSSFALHIQCC